MKLHELTPAEGSAKASFRKGRGPGSGNGKTAGKGHKGQNARSGGGVRFILDLAGIKNVRAKCLRSNNPANVVKATIEGLKSLRSAEEVAKIRDIDVAQIKG